MTIKLHTERGSFGSNDGEVAAERISKGATNVLIKKKIKSRLKIQNV